MRIYHHIRNAENEPSIQRSPWLDWKTTHFYEREPTALIVANQCPKDQLDNNAMRTGYMQGRVVASKKIQTAQILGQTPLTFLTCSSNNYIIFEESFSSRELMKHFQKK